MINDLQFLRNSCLINSQAASGPRDSARAPHTVQCQLGAPLLSDLIKSAFTRNTRQLPQDQDNQMTLTSTGMARQATGAFFKAPGYMGKFLSHFRQPQLKGAGGPRCWGRKKRAPARSGLPHGLHGPHAGVHAPRPHHARLRERQGELRAALDLAHALPVQPLDVLGNIAAFASSAAQFSEVAIAPGEHQT